MLIDTMETVENARLEAILEKYFTNSFRKGHVNVDGVTMPLRFKEMQKEIHEWDVSEEDVWICSFPKTGKFLFIFFFAGTVFLPSCTSAPKTFFASQFITLHPFLYFNPSTKLLELRYAQ